MGQNLAKITKLIKIKNIFHNSFEQYNLVQIYVDISVNIAHVV